MIIWYKRDFSPLWFIGCTIIEAHRFAITENRRLRIKNFDDQTLLSINGVGVKSSDILLKRFKDVSRLSKATYEELREVVSDSIARKVYSYFNGDF